MQYSKTFAAVIVVLLGWFNVGNLINQEEVGAIIDAILQLGGLVWVLVERVRKGDVNVLGLKRS